MKERFFSWLGIVFTSLFTLYGFICGIYLSVTHFNPWGYFTILCFTMTIIGIGMTIKYNSQTVSPNENF